jgi:hypothetical protein
VWPVSTSAAALFVWEHWTMGASMLMSFVVMIFPLTRILATLALRAYGIIFLVFIFFRRTTCIIYLSSGMFPIMLIILS